MAERRPAPLRNGAPLEGTVILRDADVGRVVDRIAHQIIETIAKGDFDAVLMGIPTRGVPLAQRLAARIEVFAGVLLPVGSVDITLYRDDALARFADSPLTICVRSA